MFLTPIGQLTYTSIRFIVDLLSGRLISLEYALRLHFPDKRI